MDNKSSNFQSNGDKGNNKESISSGILKRSLFFTFLGTAFLFSFVFIYKTIKDNLSHEVKKALQTPEVKTIKKYYRDYKKEALELIRKKEQEIISKAIIDPRIEEEKENLKRDIHEKIEYEINNYFEYVKKHNVEKFLDWMYAFSTDYISLCLKAKDMLSTTFKYIYNLLRHRESEVAKDIIQREIEERLGRDTSEWEKYIRKNIRKYLINENDIEKIIQNRINPYVNERIKEYTKNVSKIIIINYLNGLKETIKTSYPQLSERDINEIINTFLRKYSSLRDDVKEKIDLQNSVSDSIKISVAYFMAPIAIRSFYKVISKNIEKEIFTSLIRRASRKLYMRQISKLASKLTQLVVENIGRVAVSIPCLVTGIYSPICILIVFGGTDVILNKIYEALTREDTKKDILNLLRDMEYNLITYLENVYDNAIEKISFEIPENIFLNQKISDLIDNSEPINEDNYDDSSAWEDY